MVSVALLAWALHDVDPADVMRHARQARWLPFAGAVICATLTFPIRAIRWRYVLRLDGSTLPLVPLWHATAIGFMANNLLPARAGEFARAYAARRLTGVRFSAALGSVAVERVMDGLVLVGLLAVAIAWGEFARDATVGGWSLWRISTAAALVFVPALGIAFWVVHWPGPALRIARWVSARTLPQRLADRVIGILEGLLSGFEALKSPGRFVMVTAWSLVVWVVGAGSYWLAFAAFGIDIHWTAALLLQSLVAFGVALPSVPGFFGPFEAVTRATLAMYGIVPAQAISYAVAYHLAVFLPISLLGLWSLSRAHLHLADLRKEEHDGTASTA